MASLSLEQKVRLLTGADFWSLHPEPAVGLRRLVVSDGPAGVRGEHWDERDPSANVPSPTALAATWDEELVEQLGGLLASEARRKGVDVVLAPTVNLHRTPYGGRHFECFSEDPLLTARIGVSYVCGLQDGGVGATVKHFIANDSETERMTLDARLDERTLRELYLAPFEAIVREAGVWSVMASYNGGQRRADDRELAAPGHPRTASSDSTGVVDVRLVRDPLDRGVRPRGARPGDARPDRTLGRRARWRRSDAGDGRSRGDRRQGPADPAPGRSGRRARRDAPRLQPRPTTTTRSRRRCAGSRPPASCSRATTAACSRSTRARLGRIAVIGPNAGAGQDPRRRQRNRVPALHRVAARGPPRRARAGRRDRSTASACRRATGSRCAGAGGCTCPARASPASSSGSSAPTERCWRANAAAAAPSNGSARSITRAVARIEVHTVLRATDAGTYTVGASGLGRYWLSVGGEVAFDERLELRPGR